ncbi:unnamed protein product [Pieris brassicae]|uniref:Uncharacterized protein n=1 Tax=Pieris brassicae TaxID=7116 RepID=A0A9P0TM58_PIEBR|nr:unnamed protein product [Pieris brassicae]
MERMELIYLTLDIILYLSKFLNFEDFASVPMAMKGTLFKQHYGVSLLTSSKPHFRKRLPILVYKFDAARIKEERVLIDSELPVFGGILPQALEGFRSIPELHKFIEIHVHVNLCSEGRHAFCPCHLLYDDDEDAFGGLVKPPVDECEDGHQLYCPQHVTSWLNQYLKSAILLRESKELFNEDIAERYSFFAYIKI